VAMCLQKSNAGDDQSRHVLLSRDCHPSAAIQIDTTVDDASGESRDDYKWPMTISGEFRVASEPETVFEGIELSEIVVAAVENSSNELIIAAIAEALRRRGNGYFSWFINPAFGKSVRTLVGKGKPALARSLLRACVETIIGENMAGTHALRSGPGANAERVIRVRDKAAAMRRDIDQEYHLHYWSTSNGPEFAAMVVHADMSIPH